MIFKTLGTTDSYGSKAFVEKWTNVTGTVLLDSKLQYLLSICKRHKYASSGVSLVEPLFVPWWNFAITLCPLWIAPNMITFLGFLVNLQAFLVGTGLNHFVWPFNIDSWLLEFFILQRMIIIRCSCILLWPWWSRGSTKLGVFQSGW